MIMQFYDRVQELALMDHLEKTAPSFLVVTGRRRVGKTELIKQFIRGRTALYYFVDSNKSLDVLMEEFCTYTVEMLELPAYVRFDTPKTLFSFLFSFDRPLIVVFDEFQRFEKIDPSVITELQRFWDLYSRESNLFLVISGSSVGMIRKIFLEGGAPLFKRADTIVTLQPFHVRDTLAILADLGVGDPHDRLDLALLFGGTISYYAYLEKFGCRNLREALDRLVFNDLAPLRREMSDVLVEEFGREYATYYEILAALAEGRSTPKEIADSAHVAANSLPAYLADLIDLLGIVEYRVPVTEAGRSRSKMGRYFLKDNFFRFYSRFVYRNTSLYASGHYDRLCAKVLSEWPAFAGHAFEEAVRNLLSEELGTEYERIGSWWNRRGDEIDLLAVGAGGTLAVEIKNRDLAKRDARGILNALHEKVPLVRGIAGPVTLGLAARRVDGKEALRQEGYRVWDCTDLGLLP